MGNPLHLPEGIPWQHWVERWDRMQDRYLVRRAKRIGLLVNLVRGVVDPVRRILDLGCGTGSLLQPFLDAFPDAVVYGMDFDPVLLPLARERLRPYGGRAQLILGDLWYGPRWTPARQWVV
jgi:trans-aconitate methyltransferase